MANSPTANGWQNRRKRAKANGGQPRAVESSEGQVEATLSEGERKVLAVFRRYLMTPGRMLCLNNTDVGSMRVSLERLIDDGLLVAEDFRSAYSLTDLGFRVMHRAG